jgi:acyl carrier protein
LEAINNSNECVESEKVTREEIIKLILDLIHESVPTEDLSDVDPDIPLREQLELDSVDFLNIVMELQMRYGLEIPEDDFIELTSLNRCVAYLGPKLQVGA